MFFAERKKERKKERNLWAFKIVFVCVFTVGFSAGIEETFFKTQTDNLTHPPSLLIKKINHRLYQGRTNKGFPTQKSTTHLNNPSIHYTKPLLTIRLVTQESDSMTSDENESTSTIWVIGILILAALFIVAFIREKLIKPLDQLSNASKKLAGGDFDHPINLPQDHFIKEINNLIEHFENMRVNLKKAYDDLHHMAYHDSLTSLPNRALFYTRLDQALRIGERNQSKVIVMFLDIDDFKSVNDGLGHLKGDELLQLTAERLIQNCRASDTVARLGGDEFAFIIENISSRNNIMKFAKKIHLSVSKPYIRNESIFNITASIGISIYPDDGQDLESLLQTADDAMYFGKRSGKNQIRFYAEL